MKSYLKIALLYWAKYVYLPYFVQASIKDARLNFNIHSLHSSFRRFKLNSFEQNVWIQLFQVCLFLFVSVPSS